MPSLGIVAQRLGFQDIGKRIKFTGDSLPYRIRAANEEFAICTRPFNPKRTVLYTIIDFAQRIRGTENLVFGMGAETDDECWDMMARLMSFETTVSRRNRVALDIEWVG